VGVFDQWEIKRENQMKISQLIKYTILLLILFSYCSKEESTDIITTIDQGTEWPIFRGNPELSGISKTTLPDEIKLLWSFKTEDDIKSSPVIGKNRVFIGSNDGFVYALKLSNGKLIWKFDTGDAVEAPPLYLNNAIYIGSLNGLFVALDARTGTVKWKFKTEGQISGSANWFTTAKKETWIIFGSYDNVMYCLNAETGKKVWAFETGNFINGAPAILNGKIVFGGCDAVLHVLSAENGEEDTFLEAGSYIAGSAALENGRAYFGHYEGKFLCGDFEQNKIIWEYEDEEYGDAFFSSPAITKDKVIVGSRDNNLHCINKQNGEKIWIFRTRDIVDSSPVICEQKIVFGSEDGRLYIVNLIDGKQIWSYEIGGAIISSPAVAKGKIVIGADDGRIYTFGEEN
jgi:eukaryotic-like serine/threonine-protein kinase